jgi:hypothetical protein
VLKSSKGNFTSVALLSLCALAFASAGIVGLNAADRVTVAHGPFLPPDPRDGITVAAHGPFLPPDPWDGVTAVAHGPFLPPDPWDGVTVAAHGPFLPPDP